MAPPRPPLPEIEIKRIYQRLIRPVYLHGLAKPKSPTVIFVAGTPGSGKTNLIRKMNASLKDGSVLGVVISGDDMREFHPEWIKHGYTDPHAAEKYSPDAGRWVYRLYRGAIDQKVNVVFETGLRDAARFESTVRDFREGGYRIQLVVLAVEREATRRAVVARYLDAQAHGLRPRYVPAELHDAAYAKLPPALAAVEERRLLDSLQIVTRTGESVYSNTVRHDGWARSAAAVAALENVRNRPKTPTEIAQNAFAWHSLLAQAQVHPKTPKEVLDQALVWRNQAIDQALASPPAAKHYQNGLVAEAFRTMDREQFLRDFPEYEGAVARLDRARDHASKEYPNSQDQKAFVLQARERLADYIAQGRQFDNVKVAGRDAPIR